MCKICSKLALKKPERPWCLSAAFIINFEQIVHCFGVSIVGVEQLNVG